MTAATELLVGLAIVLLILSRVLWGVLRARHPGVTVFLRSIERRPGDTTASSWSDLGITIVNGGRSPIVVAAVGIGAAREKRRIYWIWGPEALPDAKGALEIAALGSERLHCSRIAVESSGGLDLGDSLIAWIRFHDGTSLSSEPLKPS